MDLNQLNQLSLTCPNMSINCDIHWYSTFDTRLTGPRPAVGRSSDISLVWRSSDITLVFLSPTLGKVWQDLVWEHQKLSKFFQANERAMRGQWEANERASGININTNDRFKIDNFLQMIKKILLLLLSQSSYFWLLFLQKFFCYFICQIFHIWWKKKNLITLCDLWVCAGLLLCGGVGAGL